MAVGGLKTPNGSLEARACSDPNPNAGARGAVQCMKSGRIGFRVMSRICREVCMPQRGGEREHDCGKLSGTAGQAMIERGTNGYSRDEEVPAVCRAKS